MKKIIGISLFLFGLATVSQAQSTVKKAEDKVETGAKKAGHATKKGAKKVGNKTAELASKGKARVTDKRAEDRIGPNGETIYVEDDGRYYWIDKKGHHQYIDASKLKSKS